MVVAILTRIILGYSFNVHVLIFCLVSATSDPSIEVISLMKALHVLNLHWTTLYEVSVTNFELAPEVCVSQMVVPMKWKVPPCYKTHA